MSLQTAFSIELNLRVKFDASSLTSHLILKEKRVENTKNTHKMGHTIRPSQKIRDSELEMIFLLVS